MYLAKRMKVTELPQMVAAFHALVGLAATATSVSNYMMLDHMDDVHKSAAFFGAFIGAVTLTGDGQHGSLCGRPCFPLRHCMPRCVLMIHSFPSVELIAAGRMDGSVCDV